MSLDYLYRSKAQPIIGKCPNEVILKEVQSLVKQEKYFLENENDQLRRNNEDLTNRIQDLYNEFDIATQIFKGHRNKGTDKTTEIKHVKKKSKGLQKKNSDLVKDNYDQRSTVNELKGQLVSSQDSLLLMKLQAKESDVGIVIKNKEVELLEAQNELLQRKIKEIESLNKDLQKECRTISKSKKNPIESKPKSVNHIGSSISIENNPNPSCDILTTEIIRFETASPTYIDIFDNKEKAELYSIKKSHQSKKFDNEQFSKSNFHNDGNLKMPNHNPYESALSPIYVDINTMRNQKMPSTVPVQQLNLELENNDKQTKFFPEDERFDQDVDKEFVKLSQEHQILNEKLDVFNSIYNNSLIRIHDDDAGMLLKKTSEEIVKISSEQHQIIDLLLKNSTTLDLLQKMKKTGQEYPLERNEFSHISENDNYQNKQWQNLSCQTDRIIEDTNQSMTKAVSIENNADIHKLIDGQNEKIRELSEKITLIQRRSPPREVIYNTKLFDSFYDGEENGDIVENKSENSFEEISNLSDVMPNESNQAIATFMAIADESKSLTSLLLSTTESKYTNNTLGPDTDSFDNIDNLPLESTLEIPTEAMISSGKIIETTAVSLENEPSSVIKTKCPSKIPKLMWSRSVDINENKGDEGARKVFSNELESSYETLYDPVSSARYEKENMILM